MPLRTAITVHCSMGALPILLSIGRSPRASRSAIVAWADFCTSGAANAGAAEAKLNTMAPHATTTPLVIPPPNNSISFPASKYVYLRILEFNSSQVRTCVEVFICDT